MEYLFKMEYIYSIGMLSNPAQHEWLVIIKIGSMLAQCFLGVDTLMFDDNNAQSFDERLCIVIYIYNCFFEIFSTTRKREKNILSLKNPIFS